jgi:hypothetical protein
MNKLAISFAMGATALFATTVTAAPLIVDASVAPDSNIQNVRMVCNEYGRCWREHGSRRVIIRKSYGYDRPLSAISSAAAMKTVAVSASALPA